MATTTIDKIDECCIIYYERNYLKQICFVIIDYYYYVVEEVKSVIKKLKAEGKRVNKNIIINFPYLNIENDNIKNTNKTIIFVINVEHTLISKGANAYDNCYYTKIWNKKDNDYYKIIIDDMNKLQKSDIIINYSVVNQTNVKISKYYKDLYKKMVLIHPLLYPYNNEKTNRNIHCLTTFLHPYCTEKRKDFLKRIKDENINHVNINNCTCAEDFIKLYKNTKILVNIHQIYEHHTVEELRILPALMCGVIVICEEGPLREYIPYQDSIIWSTNENMMKTIRDVEEKYDELHRKIFSGNHLSNLLEIMNESNKEELYNKLSL